MELPEIITTNTIQTFKWIVKGILTLEIKTYEIFTLYLDYDTYYQIKNQLTKFTYKNVYEKDIYDFISNVLNSCETKFEKEKVIIYFSYNSINKAKYLYTKV